MLAAALLSLAAAGQASGVEALDWAFRFASAIESDPKDRAKAQELVVGDYLSIGALDRAVERAAEIEGWRQGTAYADIATALARAGRQADARRLLEQAEEVRRQTEGWEAPRIHAHEAQAHAALGDTASLSAERRLEALEATRASAASIPGWKGAEALQSVAEELRRLGARRPSRLALDEAESRIAPLVAEDKAALVSNLARSWALLGEKKHARELLAAAREQVSLAMNIDQPGIWGNVAATALVLGDAEAARRDLDRALDAAEGLRNARPRALAIAAICRSLARCGTSLDGPTRARLESLLAGLGEPW